MILPLLIAHLIFSSGISFAAESPLKFSEEVTFLSKKDSPLLDLNKTADFQGILTRTEVEKADQKTLDLYFFSTSKVPKIDEKNCPDFAQRVFGPLDKISLKVTGKEIFRSPRKGMICEITFQDPDKAALFKERRLFVLVSNEKAYGIVSHFAQPANAGQADELKKFIQGLR